MPEMDLTVAVCAYNAEQRIGMVLESLAGQQAKGLQWELLVVDNASKDGTSRVAEEMGRRLGLPLRVLYEPEPGLSNARRKAAAESQAEVISFLDDDNVVGDDWARECIRFMVEHPAAGIVGAQVVPLFEDPASRPDDFEKRFAGLLSMYDKGPEAKRIVIGQDPLPVGAGMTGRRDIFRFVFGQLGSVAIGRRGDSLAGGEDMEAMYVAHRLGWEIWYSPTVRVKHWVPVRKLTDAYWEKWCIDTAQCHAWLDVLSGRVRNPSRFGCARRWLGFEQLAMQHKVRRFLPKGLRPKQRTADFWRQFYRSKAAGWHRMVWDYAMIQRFLKAVDDRVQAESRTKASSQVVGA